VPRGKNPETQKLFGAEIPVWVRRHNGDSTVRHGIQMLSKILWKLAFFTTKLGGKMVRTVDFRFSFNNFERFKKLKIVRFFVFEFCEFIFVQLFWMGDIFILRLESGTNSFSVLLRTLKISRNQMCEGLLEHPVY
jgi:hypothetical protein